jgi:hypothetical protein
MPETMPTTTSSSSSSAASTPAKARFAVELVARNFQVTATSRLIASQYAADDAHEFLPTWNYTVGLVRPAAGERLSKNAQSEPITVKVNESTPDGGRDRLYSCDASITITVDSEDAFSAGEVALELVCEPSRLGAQLAAYHEKAFWSKLLPIARAPFDQMAEVLSRRGLEAVVRVGAEGEPQPLAIDVSENGERVGTLLLIKCYSSGTGAGRRAIPSPGLHFVGEHDIEASSIPAGCPDLWFNNTPVSASDIACLDVDAFDEFFDLVMEQREEARAAATPAAHA